MQNNEPIIPDKTIELAAKDVRRVLDQQKELNQNLTAKLNILFVANSAVLSFLAVSRLMSVLSLFSLLKIVAFILNFSLLINAFLPRQIVISPNLENTDQMEYYLTLSPNEYQLQMIADLKKSYSVNRQLLGDISQSLFYAALGTLFIVIVALLHLIVAYFIPEVRWTAN